MPIRTVKGKKVRFNDIVKGCERSNIKPRDPNQTKKEACQRIAGSIEQKRKLKNKG